MIFIRHSLATLTTYCTEQKIEVGIDIRTGTNINSTQRGVCRKSEKCLIRHLLVSFIIRPSQNIIIYFYLSTEPVSPKQIE